MIFSIRTYKGIGKNSKYPLAYSLTDSKFNKIVKTFIIKLVNLFKGSEINTVMSYMLYTITRKRHSFIL